MMQLSRTTICYVLPAVSLAIVGCGRSENYEGISLSDPRLAEFREMLKVDRKVLGIPALPTTANVVVERRTGGTYDVMLHIYSKYQQRTIAFRRVDGALKWIHEQVNVEGPGTYTTVDGTFQEHLTFTYETSRVGHHNLNHLNIDYAGPDKSLAWPRELTLEDVQPLLNQWLARP